MLTLLHRCLESVSVSRMGLLGLEDDTRTDVRASCHRSAGVSGREVLVVSRLAYMWSV